MGKVWSATEAEEPAQYRSIRAILRSWAAELAPFPNRWRRAARVGFVTAMGAGVMASLQVANPLGLTLIVNFAAPEFAFSLGTGVTFLIAAAAMQMVALSAVGALVDNPVLLMSVFIAFCAITTYLIYGIPKFGRLWLWVQIPVVSAFYLVLFDHRTLGWDSAQMFAGVAIAVALLWLFNNLIWPEPAASVLRRSLSSTLERSCRRLILLSAIFVGDASPADDRGVASKLAYHLALLHPATRQVKSTREAGELLAVVMVAERIHNAIERLCEVACTQAGAACEDRVKLDLVETSTALGAALEEYIVEIGRPLEEREAVKGSLEAFHARIAGLVRSGDATVEARASADFVHHLTEMASLLAIDPSELPNQSQSEPARIYATHAFRLNKFLVRFSIRHTVAMTIAFVAGLFDNNAALRAALWLLMIGGPPSHGATAKKFTTRAIGASGALIFATLATIVLAPNFTTLPPYIAAMFLGVLIITYIGEGGGELSYLAVGATAFVIAFSGPGPRRDIVGSIWTIWGISLGMIIRAVIS
ncbi:MAG TPA: hypothetical protein VMB26_12970, partial [Candidatus Binataceae bacterium]|nr:hypothetical protein [Candidatus Binataceae bacterium]